MFPMALVRSLFMAAVLCVLSSALAQAPPMIMDGQFSDWVLVGDQLVDTTTPSGGQDLLGLKASNDATHLFLQLELSGEIDLLDDLVPQTVRLYIDADNNASTGLGVRAGFGAELQVRFDTRTVTEYIGGTSNVPWRTIDLVSLPTTTSNRFEIALALNAIPDGINPLFTSNTIKVLFRESDGGDEMPDAGGVFSYTLQAAPAPPPVIQVERLNGDLVRTVAWNVLGDGLTDPVRQPAFQRLLTTMAPDVIGFSECVSTTASQVKALLDQWLPLGGTGWQVVKDDFDMVTASRWPIMQSWPALSRQFPVLIDLPSWYTSDLLFTSAHLNCCTADATRQAQCDAFVQFIQDARTPGGVVDVPIGTVLVHAGDLNTVGWVQQLETLITGDIQNNATYGPDGPMDWDGTGLARASCRQTEGRMAVSSSAPMVTIFGMCPVAWWAALMATISVTTAAGSWDASMAMISAIPQGGSWAATMACARGVVRSTFSSCVEPAPARSARPAAVVERSMRGAGQSASRNLHFNTHHQCALHFFGQGGGHQGRRYCRTPLCWRPDTCTPGPYRCAGKQPAFRQGSQATIVRAVLWPHGAC
jgi:hypothetical protein